MDAANFEFDLLSPKFVGRSNWEDPLLINSVRVDAAETATPSESPRRTIIFKFENRTQLYDAAKLFNLEQRDVKVATFNYYPYSSFEEVVSAQWRNKVASPGN